MDGLQRAGCALVVFAVLVLALVVGLLALMAGQR